MAPSRPRSHMQVTELGMRRWTFSEQHSVSCVGRQAIQVEVTLPAGVGIEQHGEFELLHAGYAVHGETFVWRPALPFRSSSCYCSEAAVREELTSRAAEVATEG